MFGSFPSTGILWWALAYPTNLPILKSLSSVVAEILKGNPKILGSSPSPGPRPLFSGCDFMMGLGKLKRIVNFEGAGFIYYGNIREFVFKNWDKPKWGNPLLFGETDFTVGFADPMFAIRWATVVELRLQQMGNFFTKKCILQWKILNFGRL